MRRLIRKGDAPNPHLILEHLESLWSVATPPKDGRILQLERDYRFTKNVLGKLLVDTKIFDLLQKVTHALEPFVEAWSPTGIAHNDFYDDQMLITPEGKLALVDFEEIGAGDPLLDVANFLAHLRWAFHFNEGLEHCQSYHHSMRTAALERFAWDKEELNIREAYSLFRMCTNPVLNLNENWLQAMERGLLLAHESLGQTFVEISD